RVGGKVFLYYLGSSALAITVGLTVATLFSPGSGMTLNDSASFSVPDNPGVIDALLNIVPNNIVGCLLPSSICWGIIFYRAGVWYCAAQKCVSRSSSMRWGEQLLPSDRGAECRHAQK
ncbi:hypothetical protein DK37_07160, partial [Halomonas sp. SUBG004]